MSETKTPSRLFHHFNRLLPGAGASPSDQIVSAIYVAAVGSQDETEVPEFDGAWWDAIDAETKKGFLTIVAMGVLQQALGSLKPHEAVAAVIRPILSLTPEDRRDLDA